MKSRGRANNEKSTIKHNEYQALEKTGKIVCISMMLMGIFNFLL